MVIYEQRLTDVKADKEVANFEGDEMIFDHASSLSSGAVILIFL